MADQTTDQEIFNEEVAPEVEVPKEETPKAAEEAKPGRERDDKGRFRAKDSGEAPPQEQVRPPTSL